jgi:hypothetical protein
MLNTKSLSWLTAAIFLSVFPLQIKILPAWSQKAPADLTVPLLKGAKCVTSTTYDGASSSNLFTDINTSISVNQRLYTPSMRLFTPPNNSITLTCKASDPKHLRYLKLAMGVSDDDAKQNSLMTVNIYQGGTKKHTYGNVRPGSKRIDTTLDLQNRDLNPAEDIAIELLCHKTTNYCNLYFLQAEIQADPETTITPKSSKSTPSVADQSKKSSHLTQL